MNALRSAELKYSMTFYIGATQVLANRVGVGPFCASARIRELARTLLPGHPSSYTFAHRTGRSQPSTTRQAAAQQPFPYPEKHLGAESPKTNTTCTDLSGYCRVFEVVVERYWRVAFFKSQRMNVGGRLCLLAHLTLHEPPRHDEAAR